MCIASAMQPDVTSSSLVTNHTKWKGKGIFVNLITCWSRWIFRSRDALQVVSPSDVTPTERWLKPSVWRPSYARLQVTSTFHKHYFFDMNLILFNFSMLMLFRWCCSVVLPDDIVLYCACFCVYEYCVAYLFERRFSWSCFY